MEISVVVTAHNYARFLPNCLDSLLHQTLPRENYEIIVVDDHSTDNTAQLLIPYGQKPNIVLITNETNMGVAGAANRGIQTARGRYVVRVDADDYVDRRFLTELLAPFLAKPGLFGCACNYDLVDVNDQLIEKKSSMDTPIACGVMYRRTQLLDLGAYNSDFRTYEHQELCLRMTSHHEIHYLNTSLYSYRRHTENQSIPSQWRSNYKSRLDSLQNQASITTSQSATETSR